MPGKFSTATKTKVQPKKTTSSANTSSSNATLHPAKVGQQFGEQGRGSAHQAKDSSSDKLHTIEADLVEKFQKEASQQHEQDLDSFEYLSEQMTQEQSAEKKRFEQLQKSQEQRQNNSPSSSQNDFSKSQQQAQEKREEQEEQKQELQEQFEEGKEDLEEKKQEAIEATKQKENEQIQRINSGPHGITRLYTSPLALFGSMAGDSIIGLVPIAGAFLGFIFNIGYWLVPFFFTGNLLGYTRVVGFYIADLILTLIGDFFDWFFYLGELLDLIPEGLAFMKVKNIPVLGFFAKNSPPAVLIKSYEDSKPKKIARVRTKASAHIDSINKATKDKIAKLKKKLNGKRVFLHGIEPESHKMVASFAVFLITVTGPVSLYLPVAIPSVVGGLA